MEDSVLAGEMALAVKFEEVLKQVPLPAMLSKHLKVRRIAMTFLHLVRPIFTPFS